MSGKNSLTVKTWDIAFTSKVFFKSLSVMSKIFFPVTIPALLIRISTVPKVFQAIYPALTMSSMLVTSHFIATAGNPSSVIYFTVSSAAV